MVDAVDEARRQLRENALPKARERGREPVPTAEEAALARALAALVESAAELAEAISERITTPDTRKTYTLARDRLRREARNLAGDEKDITRRAR
ncbi:hypothetical protein [Kitasatospora cathayae]|uniref:Uncharacterized protein n=1 Tax=Kitasatospora cathayae TaxID=3004092 RepID=A0ABY7QC30_9ACTN|nr:hypothetical protein [Kitasatospora sp. HUAS 3-15]WBP90272.1 hypothetical protein O1G21_33365 [Kitasatospora sp. HUAS 3-15]